MRHFLLCGMAALTGILLAAPLSASAHAGEAKAATLGPSGLPLPRFVSIKASKVNLRIGPGTNYPVDWMYVRQGLPLEIIQEYSNWRRVRDADGTEGWISQALLSGKRTAVVEPWNAGKTALADLRSGPSGDAGRVARVEPGAIGTVTSCSGQWCHVDFSGTEGWMEQAQLWGVYPGEKVDD
ncbi:hypothetical protein CSC94_03535 [Zhengella mangrovi]|uniref:SH3b domain-containing protein n=1 Tax=Zhengella mangrovi TaxID=1982044 RepID=A0A2G1QV30_9HYPH|nr:SH3 domain-containing protein [Zhengella mangrovi]PHP69058.1 hypothetical protein CSC94_03535 [Zhengella mangrovi]